MLVMSNSGGGCDGPTSTDRADADAKTSTGGDERLLGSDGGDSSLVSVNFFSSSVTKRPNKSSGWKPTHLTSVNICIRTSVFIASWYYANDLIC